ncbi:phospholipase D-like domain-containing protein [Streptomyces sp. cg36]|uniref:phospholipase D-like domain-containing protein n=1 Tax=Streptomyces sp. cg36 TaxID=3238798 RepID=UPI0034E2E686
MKPIGMSGRLRTALGAFAVATGVLTGMLVGPVDSAGAAAVTTGPVFNDPTGDGTAQQAIRSQVRSVVANADSGTSLRLAMYHLWDETVADELAAAKTQRGIGVKVVLDASTRDFPAAYDILRSALGTDTTKSSYVKLCATGSSCLGPAGTGINHNKFLLAGSVGGGTQKNVVVQLTSNLTPSNYARYWNSSITVAGNAELYAGYLAYFDKLPAQNRGAWSYTYGNAGDYKYYFFPRAGTDATTDTVVNALDNITCRWTDAAGAHRTSVHAAMLKISRQAVADKLRALAGAGCLVDLVYSETDTGTWNALHGVSGITNRCYQHDDDADSGTPNRIVHSKNVMVDGMYADTVQKVMWTGSHNWSGPALRDNDEAMLRITTPSVYSAFEANFQAARAAAVPGTSDNVAACKSE